MKKLILTVLYLTISKKFIVAVLKPQQASSLKKNINKYDKNAFVIGMATFDITGGWISGKYNCR